MANSALNLGGNSIEEEIAHPEKVRPHLVILGAGASRAALPQGDINGKRLPLMADFAEIVPVGPILDKNGIEWRGKNFEEVYSTISEDENLAQVREELEAVVFEYFSSLRLPNEPTIYDLLVLSLRKKDVIATFNWDPLLIQAIQRNHRVTNNLPSLLFLHGNVAHGYCAEDCFQGPRGERCQRCGVVLRGDKLLFPVRQKNYSDDASIDKAWEVTKVALKESLVVTVFGYSAPTADQDALAIMSEAWGKPAKRQFELFEMIDIRLREEIRTAWAKFIFSQHYRVSEKYSDSFLALHPRRSIEAFLKQYIHGNFIDSNPVPAIKTLEDLHAWFRPLIEAEQS